MKFRITRKEIKNNYKYIIEVGYCDLCTLLRYKNAVAFNSGTYGWNYDVFDCGGGVAIVTGYRPFGNIRPKYTIIDDFEHKAFETMKTTKDYEDLKAKLDDLIQEFIKAVVE